MESGNHVEGAVVAPRPRILARKPTVAVEYPGAGETISHPSYTIQIAVSGPAAAVDLSINQEEWRPCRESSGRWWFDWERYESGEYEAVARLRRPDGTKESSEPKIFWVKLG